MLRLHSSGRAKYGFVFGIWRYPKIAHHVGFDVIVALVFWEWRFITKHATYLAHLRLEHFHAVWIERVAKNGACEPTLDDLFAMDAEVDARMLAEARA